MYLTALLAGGVTTGYGQEAPQMQQILDRLDRLEKDNQALLEEVRALRQEISGLRTPAAASAEGSPAGTASGTGQASAAAPSIDERLAVQQNRIEELAQTKVESSEKFPIRITGMALFNAGLNGQHNGNADNPTTASLGTGDVTGEGTLRQSTLGLLFDGPRTFLGGKVSGSLYLDFFGGSTASLNHLVRLRTAAVNLDWRNTSIMVGQDKPLISPRDPDSLAQVGVSPLTAAGNLWLWQPQLRVEQRFALGEDSGLRAQFAIFQTSFYNYTSFPSAYMPPPPEQQAEYSRPGVESRWELWHRWGDTERIEIAGGVHYNRNYVQSVGAPSEVYSLDWFVRPVAKLEFSGMFFHGQNVSPLGALRQGFSILPNGSVIPVVSSGGWAQLHVPITSRLAFNIYGGQQDDRNADLLYGGISKNQGYFSNFMYRLAPNVIVSLEGGQVRTSYLGIGNRLNDHYDVALAYLF